MSGVGKAQGADYTVHILPGGGEGGTELQAKLGGVGGERGRLVCGTGRRVSLGCFSKEVRGGSVEAGSLKV